MRPATKHVIAALDGKRLTARQITEKVNYSRGAVNCALTVLVATDQAMVVDPDETVPVYQLTGEVCPRCGQVER